MEEDEETTRSVPPWVELEYAHMLSLAGPKSKVHFTNLSKSSCEALLQSPAFKRLADSESGTVPTRAEGHAHRSGVIELLNEREKQQTEAGEEGKPVISLDRVCLLDPKATQELSPEDGGGKFDWFLFGGILGDDPPRDRTSELRRLSFPTRHLGPVQMTTDTALGVTKLVVEDKVPLDKIPFVDYPTIRFNSKESVEMPFRYITKDGEPILPPGMRELLHEDLNKSFDF
ncbi:hypothetical protein AX16_000644 [Volvariella volvacea WC 439]|nr:hypothetical protein AX16_000644 [Volvariella volvacea WC 439]